MNSGLYERPGWPATDRAAAWANWFDGPRTKSSKVRVTGALSSGCGSDAPGTAAVLVGGLLGHLVGAGADALVEGVGHGGALAGVRADLEEDGQALAARVPDDVFHQER